MKHSKSMYKRMVLLISTTILILLLALSAVVYFSFRLAISEKILSSQELLVKSNAQLYQNFSNAIDQMSYQFTSDESIGHLLSIRPGENALRDANLKSAVTKQLAFYLNSQSSLSDGGFNNILYVNPNLPVAQLLVSDELPILTSSVSRVYSAEAVQTRTWYENALISHSDQYVFLDEDKGWLCFAKKVQNSFYTGVHQKDGLGVLLASVPLSQLAKNLSFTPITENSIYALISQNNELLFMTQSETPINSFTFDEKQLENGTTLTLDDKEYLYSLMHLDFGVKLIFLTPASDISKELSALMSPFLMIAIIFLICGVVLALVLARRISAPMVKLANAIENIDESLEPDFSSLPKHQDSEFQLLVKSFQDSFFRIRQLISRIQVEEEQRRKMELQALQAQINPHFMLNAMNAVNWLALEEGQDQIADTVASIANLMRYSITEPDRLVSVNEELKNCADFIAIYVLRFGSKITLHTDTISSSTELIIPKFTLQPLIENSIRHGISKLNSQIEITLRAESKRGFLKIDVSDDGKGADVQKLNDYLAYRPTDLQVTHGFGIRNVNERLKLRYGNDSGLSYRLNDQGQLTATLLINNNSSMD